MNHISMLYMRSWLVALGSYVFSYSMVLTLMFYYYMPKFLSETTVAATILDILYYSLLICWAACCSVMAIRAYELTDRRRYFSIKQQEKEIKEWKRLLEDLPEPVVFSHRGRISFFNSATLDMLGAADTTTFAETSTELTSSMIVEGLRKIRMKGRNLTLLDFIMEKVGTELTAEASFVYRKGTDKRNLTIRCTKPASPGEDRLSGFIFHDMTAFKALQKNKVKERCFDVMLATASHDIRTPLNIMMGVLDMLEEYYPLSDECKKQVKVVRDCGQRMVLYLNGLTLISKIDTGTLELKKHTFRPAALAMGILDNMELSAQTKHLSLMTRFDPSLPDQVCADEEMYTVVLQNIMENALKYTFDGGATISLAYDQDTATLHTDVIDTGIGMSPEQVRDAGELFKKISCELNPQGIGLGLFLAKMLSRRMGGELKISSQQGRGTTVSFAVKTSPLCEAVPNMLSASTMPLPWRDSKLPTTLSLIPESKAELELETVRVIPLVKACDCDCAKILIVDDEPLNLVVLAGYMKSLHTKVDQAENGQIAIDMIERHAQKRCCQGYKVVFMDINMPVMDGIRATNIIRDYVKKGRIDKCSVVAVTAAARLDQPEVYGRYIAEGFAELRMRELFNSRVVSKPVSKKRFLCVLSKYLELPSKP